MFYVAVDVGCLECGEESAVLGIFENEQHAQTACDWAEKKQTENWGGEHRFEVFSVETLGSATIPDYS